MVIRDYRSYKVDDALCYKVIGSVITYKDKMNLDQTLSGIGSDKNDVGQT